VPSVAKIPSLRSLACRGLALDLATPRIMGIVNTSPDSFHADSRLPSLDAALAHARRLVAEGADLLDIGGQSTRPGYVEISDAEETARTAPLLRALAAEFPRLPLSIDTYKPAVAAAALEAGAHILNDIYGLQGPGGPALARLAAESGAALVVMHNDPALRQNGVNFQLMIPSDAGILPVSGDDTSRLLSAVLTFLHRSLDIAAAAGLPRERLVIDPGVGFGKTPAQNIALLRRLDALHQLGLPVLLGVSRKSVFGHILPELATPADRLEATLAATALAVAQGVQLHRVHDVVAARRAALVAAALNPAR
jgi:dihydropteroate synthase